MAVTFSADLNAINLWLDGQHISYLVVPAHATAGNSLPLEIGRNGPSSAKYWIGKLDDVRIWNIARTGADITASYRAVALRTSKPRYGVRRPRRIAPEYDASAGLTSCRPVILLA